MRRLLAAAVAAAVSVATATAALAQTAYLTPPPIASSPAAQPGIGLGATPNPPLPYAGPGTAATVPNAPTRLDCGPPGAPPAGSLGALPTANASCR
jgi:hypothetical protein